MMHSIPVLFVIQHLDQGGTEHHFHDLVIGLDRKIFRPHVAYFNGGLVSDLIEQQGDTPIFFSRVMCAYNHAGLKTIWKLRQYIIRHRIQLVVTYHFVADFIGTLAASGLPGVRVISSRRDMGFTRSSRQKKIGHYLDRGVDRYVAVSNAVRQAVAQDEKVAPDKIDVIYNGIDLRELKQRQWSMDEERQKLGIKPGETVITCVSNFNKIKGHLTLIDAFARLQAMHATQPLRLILAGDGLLRTRIEEKVAGYGLVDQVNLVGISRNVERELMLADFAVLPSETEGFSNSIIQAMALRRPVVACRVGGNPEAIAEGQTGFLAEPRDADDLAKAMSKLVADPELRRTMGLAGEARAKKYFDKKAMISETENLFLGVLGFEALAQRAKYAKVAEGLLATQSPGH